MSFEENSSKQLAASLSNARGKTLKDFKLTEGSVDLIFSDGVTLWIGSMGCRDEPVLFGGEGSGDDPR